MPADRSSTGKIGEDAAAGYLSTRGCEIIARNRRTNPGEVDIIAECTDRAGGEKTLAFIEVRTRHGERGTAEESISRRKAASMTSAAYAYMAAHDLDPETTRWRIDLVAIAMRGRDIVAIDWIQNALEG